MSETTAFTQGQRVTFEVDGKHRQGWYVSPWTAVSSSVTLEPPEGWPVLEDGAARPQTYIRGNHEIKPLTDPGISDITWEMMSDAGIETSAVTRTPTETGTDEYVLIKGDLKIAFGPATAEPGNDGPLGWNIATYLSEIDDPLSIDSGSHWEQSSQEWAPTAATALEIVASDAAEALKALGGDSI